MKKSYIVTILLIAIIVCVFFWLKPSIFSEKEQIILNNKNNNLGLTATTTFPEILTNEKFNSLNKPENIQELNTLLNTVSKLIILPTGETPTVIELKDVATLAKSQPFYEGAQDGDLVIIYEISGQAIIYSPSKNIIVKSGPISKKTNNTTPEEIISAVSKLTTVPSGEKPIIAIISDIDNLAKSSAFYSGAQNGDYVLIYQNESRGIIYSPSRNIIVNDSPVVKQN